MYTYCVRHGLSLICESDGTRSTSNSELDVVKEDARIEAQNIENHRTCRGGKGAYLELLCKPSHTATTHSISPSVGTLAALYMPRAAINLGFGRRSVDSAKACPLRLMCYTILILDGLRYVRPPYSWVIVLLSVLRQTQSIKSVFSDIASIHRHCALERVFLCRHS